MHFFALLRVDLLMVALPTIIKQVVYFDPCAFTKPGAKLELDFMQPFAKLVAKPVIYFKSSFKPSIVRLKLDSKLSFNSSAKHSYLHPKVVMASFPY